jgi:proteasome lid subunit RPN8/RPN11
MKTYGIINSLKTGSTTPVTQPVTPSKYIVTECYNIVRNMFVQPDITQLYITAKAWIKLMCFIHLVGEYEITGFGRIQKDVEISEGTKVPLAITDFDIIKQEVKSAYVEATDEAVLDFMRKLPADQRGEWTLDWHSHVNMGVSPSGTDWTNYSSMLAARMYKQFPAMIVNKRGEVSMHQIITAAKHPDIKVQIIIDDLNEEEFSAIYRECKEKVENLCTKATVVTTYTSYGNKDGAYKNTYTGYNSYKRWWEEDDDIYDHGYASPKQKSLLNTSKTAANLVDEEDEEVKAAQEAGYVIEEAYDCPYCGLPVRESDTVFPVWGMCEDCMADYEASSGEKLTGI